MAMNQAHHVYQNNAVTTASPGDLTLMLYNGCLKFVKQAKADMANNNIQGKNTNIQKAQKIIQEFMVTLDMKYEVSQNMMVMYDYLNNRLMEANVKNDSTILDEVEGHVIEFRDTWKEVMKATRSQKPNMGGRA